MTLSGQWIQHMMLVFAVAVTMAVASSGGSHEVPARGQCASGTSPSVDGTGGHCETSDEVQMLQRGTGFARLEASPGYRNSPRSSHVQDAELVQAHANKRAGSTALALDGGGWTALSVQTGILVGVLVSRGKDKGIANPTLENTGLLDQVEFISSVSGGSWFAVELLYSDRFINLINQMAADPAQASALFTQEWLDPYEQLTQGSHLSTEALGELGTVFGSATVSQLANVLGIMDAAEEDTVPSWSAAIQLLLQATADIPANLTLDSAQANSWAKGKVWLACNSLAIPNGQQRQWAFVSHPLGTASYDYWSASQTASAPQVIPSKISWRIGDAAATPSPFPLVASTALPSDTTLQWGGVDRGGYFGETWTKTSGPLGTFASLQENNGALPVYKVAASSSAVLSGITLSSTGDEATAFGEMSLQLPVYAAANPAADETAFAAADRILNKVFESNDASEATTNSLGGTGVFALFDGAYTDNTAIGHAVAAGATRVIALQQSGFSDLIPLFQEQSATPVSLFGVGWEGANFGIFTFPDATLAGKTASEHLQELINSFSTMVIDPSKYVTGIQVGEIPVITRANEWFGIESNRTVSLTLINVDVGLGGLDAAGLPVVSSNDAYVASGVALDIVNAFMKEDNKEFADTLVQALGLSL